MNIKVKEVPLKNVKIKDDFWYHYIKLARSSRF
jgi:hypothetical protein